MKTITNKIVSLFFEFPSAFLKHFIYKISIIIQDLRTKMKNLQQDKQSTKEPQIKQVKQNKMLIKCLRTLMHQLLHQFRSQSYNSNSILSIYYNEMQQLHKNVHYYIQPMSTADKSNGQLQKTPITINEISEQSRHSKEEDRQSSLNPYPLTQQYYQPNQYKQIVEMWSQISVLIWEISRSPKWYVQMLQNQEIYAEESQCIDMHVFTTKIYKRVMSQVKKMTPYAKVFQDLCADQIYFFLEEVSLQICQCFKSGQNIVLNQINLVTQVVQKSEIVTFYLLYKIFRDTASICRHKITTQLEQGLFRNIETEVVNNFAHYIIQKYEVLDMKMNSQKKLQEQVLQRVSITQKIMNSKGVKWRQAIREDGQIGILVELKDEGDKSTNYMLVFGQKDDDLNVVHSNSIHKQWKVCKQAEQNYDILHLIKSKKALAQKMRNSSTKAPIQMTLLDNIGVLGGSMGKCLAQIDMYDNVGDFMVSLSKRTIIGGSFNYLLMSVPLLGYVFVTGGFTYTFYYIFSNQYANSDKKFRELRNITLGSATSIGSGLIGATVGQSLIPIPVLGAFIGGLVGGFIGQLGSRAMSNVMETARFKQLLEEMRNTIQPKGYWDVTDRTLQVLQIKKQKFYETIPASLDSRMNCDRIWLTIVFFTLLCFQESRQRIKAMQKIMKQSKKLEKKLSNYEIIQANEQMSQRKDYEPSIDFMCILHFFDDNQIIFIEYHDDVAFLLNKIFARLK